MPQPTIHSGMPPSLPGRRNLLCVLDWGLGHASRSLALLGALEKAGELTFLASCGRARKFLEQERPDLTVHDLPAYDVRYPTGNMPLNVGLQLPKWLRTIAREKRQTARLVEELRIDRIISDSRFGCYHPRVESVMLTHQLHPIFNFGPMSWSYVKYLRRFREVWVPDAANRKMSGRLSDPKGYKNVRFIGPLSRLAPGTPAPENWHTLSLLSGPEPMRSRLEKILLEQLRQLTGPHLLIRGVPDEEGMVEEHNIVIKPFADRQFLARHLPAAQFIICRSGYSTLMDLAALNLSAKVILIPTPGQTEQELLAQTQVQSGDALAAFAQGEIDLAALIK